MGRYVVFSTDEETINYLKLTEKDNHHLNLVKQYLKPILHAVDEKNYNPKFLV